MEQQTGSKVGKEYIKAVYFHTAFLMNFYEKLLKAYNKCILEEVSFRLNHGDFPGGSVVKNLSCKAGNTGLIPGQGTKILCCLWSK